MLTITTDPNRIRGFALDNIENAERISASLENPWASADPDHFDFMVDRARGCIENARREISRLGSYAAGSTINVLAIRQRLNAVENRLPLPRERA